MLNLQRKLLKVNVLRRYTNSLDRLRDIWPRRQPSAQVPDPNDMQSLKNTYQTCSNERFPSTTDYSNISLHVDSSAETEINI